MASNPIALLLEGIHPTRSPRAWHGGPTPVGALRGVSAGLAAWRPAPGRKSIWELALHVAYWDYAVRRQITGGARASFPRSPANFPAMPARPTEAAWKLDLALVRAEHRQLVAACKTLSPRALDRIPIEGKRWNYGDVVLGIVLHDTYHTGQIQLLKRLGAARRARRKG